MQAFIPSISINALNLAHEINEQSLFGQQQGPGAFSMHDRELDPYLALCTLHWAGYLSPPPETERKLSGDGKAIYTELSAPIGAPPRARDPEMD